MFILSQDQTLHESLISHLPKQMLNYSTVFPSFWLRFYHSSVGKVRPASPGFPRPQVQVLYTYLNFMSNRSRSPLAIFLRFRYGLPSQARLVLGNKKPPGGTPPKTVCLAVTICPTLLESGEI
jgi:hypothetical protein